VLRLVCYRGATHRPFLFWRGVGFWIFMILFKFFRSFFTCALLCWVTALAQTLGGTVIANGASSSYSVLGLDSSTTSNTVESSVPSFCSFTVTPNGTSSSPARSVDAIPGATIYLPYTLSYTGNVMTDIDVTALVDASSALLPENVTVILDSNDNQHFDIGDAEISSLENVPFGSSTALLLAVTLEPSYSSVGAIDVNLRANCKGETIFDDDNLSRVNVLRGGVSDFVKISVPTSNSQVTPGNMITYGIGFIVNERVLENAVISDVLDDALEEPTTLRVSVNNVERVGAVVYNSTTRTVTATLGTLNPNDEVVLTIAARVSSTTSGGVRINNEAVLNFIGGSLTTNRVTHVTPATCAVVIKADGSIAKPGFTERALPGDTVVYPYTLTNLGNVTNDFALETTLVQNSFIPTLSIVQDTNNNNLVDASELTITHVDDLPSGETVQLLLVVTIPNDLEINGDAFVNVTGRCSSEPTITDDDNISRVTVPNGGIADLQKSSDPAPSSLLYPDAEVHYFIEFTTNGRDLNDVVVSDVLDDRFTVPSSFTTGQTRDDESGLTASVVGNYDEATRKLTWTLANVPARMKVRLEFVTSVESYLHPQNGDAISNTAMVSSSDIPETSTNTVTHPLSQLEILLSKVATPERVFIGDTLTYTLTAINPEDSIVLRELVLTDTLPDELRYQVGSAKVKLPSGEEQALEPTTVGQTLTWTLPGVEPGEQIVVTMGTDVLASAASVEELVNTANLVASDVRGRAVAAAAANVATVIDKGVFTAPAVLLGTVFEDLNGNNTYDEDVDSPVSGVRLYLSDGRSVVSDDLGRYTFPELPAGLNVVKVDETTLPTRLLAETKTEATPGLWRVRLEEGLITRQDVPLLPPSSSLEVRQQNTTITVDMVAYQLPVIDGLVLIQKLPEGVHYISGSTLIDGEVVADPLQSLRGASYSETAGTNLVFELPEKSMATLSFDVIHEVNYRASSKDSTLIALTPKPEVLIGSEDALRYYEEAVPIDVEVAVRERVGAVILSPATKIVIRSGSSTNVTVDTPLEDTVKLFVNDEEISESRIGTKTLDGPAGRQTFTYIGLTLKEGRNVIRLESVDVTSAVSRDEIEVYLAGVPGSVEIAPVSELVADSSEPLQFDLRVRDAWGNAPIDSFVTLEIDGASPADADADTQQAGYQVAFTNGQAILRLGPVTEPKAVTITAVIGKELGKRTFAITSNLRDWLVDGYASVGTGVSSDGFNFGVGGSAFARGRISNDYLLTLAANYPFNALGYFGSDPLGQAYIAFPVTGSSEPLNQDAYSQHGVYARLERDQNYLQYGDFTTMLEGTLLPLSRTYTGLSFDYNTGFNNSSKEGFGIRGYATFAKPSDRVTDLYIKSDGTREYTVPDKAIKLDTLQLEVVKGDCETPRDFINDNDVLLRPLRQGVDYVADKLGIIRLAFRLPLADALGKCYYLKANYQLEPDEDSAQRLQFGVQGTYKVGVATFRTGFYRETGLQNSYASVLATGVKLETNTLTGDAEIAYGQNQDTGGLAATLRVAYKQAALSSEVSYRYFATGFRSAVIRDASSAGHELKLAASYALTTNFILSADTQWRQYAEDATSQLESSVLATYTASGDTQVGEVLLGREPALQFGVQYSVSRVNAGGVRGVAGVNIKDIFGLNRTEASIIHRQGVGTSSVTDFSVAYQLLENLALRFTDRLTWGSSNNFIVGLEAGFENDDILSSVCEAISCLADPIIPLGTTKVTAQYELSGGIAGEVGRAQLGVDTEVPLTDKLTVTVGASQSLEFSDSSNNETVLSAGASYNESEVIQAEITNDLRFGVTVKDVYFAGATFALAENVYGNTTIDYLYDGASLPKHGFKFGVAFAYRGDRVSLLSTQTARLGLYAESKVSELTGDTRVNYQLDETWSFRVGYLYASQPELGFRDMTTFGVTGNLWQGGSLTAYGKLFHDWQGNSWNLGMTLETSQEITCGVYGVVGANLFNGVAENYGATFGEPGVFLRFDIVFDEQWTCGSGTISGQTFIDLNADGSRSENEMGRAGFAIELLDNDGKLLKTTYSGDRGQYKFSNLKSGRYILQIVLPANYQFSPVYMGTDRTRDNDIRPFGQSGVLELDRGQHLNTIDIGIVQTWGQP
jgi:fimbrial isopeptide formation D2 family protein